MTTTYTHPDVLGQGIHEGWADPEDDPTRIDWPARQARAVIPFQVVDGRPVNPHAPTGIRFGRNELGHWGEQVCADAVVFATDEYSHSWIVMVERADGHGWALPGGKVDPGEDHSAAAVRELREETGLDLTFTPGKALAARYVPDPRASDEAWMVTVPSVFSLGSGPRAGFPPVKGTDDAIRAEWMRADSYEGLVAYLQAAYQGGVFSAHVAMLQDLLG